MMSNTDAIGYTFVCAGIAIIMAALIIDFVNSVSDMLLVFIPMPDWHDDPWVPESSMADILERCRQEEAAENSPLTLHESANSWCGPPLPHHHPTTITA